MVLTQKQIRFLGKYVDNLNAILLEDDMDELLLAIDDIISSTGEKGRIQNAKGSKLKYIYNELQAKS